MTEGKMLAAVAQERAHFDALSGADIDEYLSDKGKAILEEIADYYATDAATNSVDLELLGNRLARKYPKHEQLFRTVISSFAEPVSGVNILLEVVALKREALKEKLIAALAGGKEQYIDTLMAEWQAASLSVGGSEVSSVFNGVSLDELLTKTSEADRLLVEPVDMGNQLAGGPLRGHNTIIFARPDVGKTACALTIAASALRQEKRVLYCGNEDPAEVMIERLISNLTNVPLNRLHLDPQRIMSVADSRGYQSFFFVEMYPGSASEIERHVQQVEPDVLIVDQLRNLKDKDTNRVIQLDTVARELRNLGKKYRLYNFALTQAGDSAENKLYLEMGDVDFSNTGIPGAADCMIGIGATREYIAQGHRMLSFPKNKIGGGSGREPVRVTLDVSRSKFV
jgi:hypothetical protein